MSDTIPSGIRTTLRVLADIHAELDASRTNAGSGASEHTAAPVAPAKAQKVA